MRIRRHVTYANVAATLAVVIALTGTSYAAVMITGKDVKNSSLTGKDVKDSSLIGGDVRNGSLAAGDFKPGQLPSGPPGADGQQGPGAFKIDLTVANGTAQDVAFGPFALRVICHGVTTEHGMVLKALGSSALPGSAQMTAIRSLNDASPSMLQAGGALADEPAMIGIGNPYMGDIDTDGDFFRAGGTLVLLEGADVTTVVFDMFLEDRSSTGTCYLRGTATPSP